MDCLSQVPFAGVAAPTHVRFRLVFALDYTSLYLDTRCISNEMVFYKNSVKNIYEFNMKIRCLFNLLLRML